MKIVVKENLSDMETEYMLRELSLLAKIDFPYVLNVEELLHDDFNYYIVTELCEGTHLQYEVDKRN